MDWLTSVVHAINEIFNTYKVQIVGSVGAALALQFNPDARRTKGSAFVFIATGCVISSICTGFFVRAFGLSEGDDAMVGFLLGTFGGAIMAAVYKAIMAADLWGLAKAAWHAKFGGE